MSGWPELDAVLGAEFERELRAVALASVPYTRELEGYPDWCLFTDAQWESYDEWNELADAAERKYGRLLPRAAAMMRANRGIW